MVDKWEVIERFASGQKMRRDDWILSVHQKSTELAKEYKVRYKPETNEEKMLEMAEKVWISGRKLAANMGCYMLENGRISKFDEDEIMRHFIHIPSKVTVGDGKDTRVIQKRHVNGFEPYLIGAGGQSPSTMDIAIKNWRAQLALPCVDMVEGFNLPFIGPWKDEKFRSAGQPQEILATYYQVSSIRNILNDAGKPGLCYYYYPQSKMPATHIAALNPIWGIRRTDLMRTMGSVGIMTIEEAWLSIAFAVQNYGCPLTTSGFSTPDYAGGIENAVITAVASSLLSFITYGGTMGGLGVMPGRPSYGAIRSTRDPRENRWINKICEIIKDKYYQMPDGVRLLICNHEPGNPLRWLFEGIATMRAVSGGASAMTIYRAEPPRIPNLITPLDIQFCADVAKAVNENKIMQSEVREIVKKLLSKEDLSFRGLPSHELGPYLKGKPFEELYDTKKFIASPNEEYLKSYEDAKKKIRTAGLPIE